MMGTADPQPSMFYHINLEQYVTADHPMRKIRPLIDTARGSQKGVRSCNHILPCSACFNRRLTVAACTPRWAAISASR